MRYRYSTSVNKRVMFAAAKLLVIKDGKFVSIEKNVLDYLDFYQITDEELKKNVDVKIYKNKPYSQLILLDLYLRRQFVGKHEEVYANVLAAIKKFETYIEVIPDYRQKLSLAKRAKAINVDSSHQSFMDWDVIIAAIEKTKIFGEVDLETNWPTGQLANWPP